MDPLRSGGKDRATLLGVVTNGNHIIEGLPHELVHRLRSLARNIDPDFAHGGDSFRAHVARFRAGAENIERRASIVSEQAFRHLTACRIARTKDKDSHSAATSMVSFDMSLRAPVSNSCPARIPALTLFKIEAGNWAIPLPPSPSARFLLKAGNNHRNQGIANIAAKLHGWR